MSEQPTLRSLRTEAAQYMAESMPSLIPDLIGVETEMRRIVERETYTDRVRAALWISHGHDGLYGDDGEMQCNTPPLIADFLRDPLPALLNHCELARLSRKEPSMNEPIPITEPLEPSCDMCDGDHATRDCRDDER